MSRRLQQFLRLSLCVSMGLAAAAAGFAGPWGSAPRPGDATVEVAAPLGSGGQAGAAVPVIVELIEPPAAVDYALALADQSVPREKAMANARAAAIARVEQLAPRHEEIVAAMAAAPINAQEMFRLSKALNAIAVMVDPAQMDQIRLLPGIKSVRRMTLEYPTNATSVPFIGAPPVWGNTLGLGRNITGAGVKIGIIDTGIDYQHPDFGGTGHRYPRNDRVHIDPSLFPTAKVVGGIDFVGDDYPASPAKPDPNPTDCAGHGSHVAGTAAGFGVNADGTTYTGPYGPGTPFGSLRIGPGVAPQALLYSIKVFGCSGGTAFAPKGIEWAMDPTGKGDFSNHLDVINLSLGSPYGGLADVSAQAADNAALVGIVVVASAGNSGDTFFIAGSPAASDFAISVAASVDPGAPINALKVNSPPSIAGTYRDAPAAFGPLPSGETGTVVQVLSATGPATEGCDATFTNAAAVTGNIALIKRGTCGFQIKVNNAQANGAIAAIVYNNVTGDSSLVTMGPTSGQPPTTIASVFITTADGQKIAAQSGVANATLAVFSVPDSLAGFSSRGPRTQGFLPVRLKPDIAAPGLLIPSAQSGMTCQTGGGCITPSPSGFLPGGQVLVISGTSMAAPHVTGTIALLRQLHPDWSVEELKALAMNGAIHDVTTNGNGAGLRYGVGRIGAGRVDVSNAATNQVTAFSDDDPGTVTLSFESAVVGKLDQIKQLRLVNHGSSAATFDVGLDNINPAPGVTFSLPGSPTTITVPANSAVQVPVQLHADASKMNHTADPTVAAVQSPPAPLNVLGNLPRHVLTEAGSYLTLGQGGKTKARVPFYSAAFPASAMLGTYPIVTGGGGSGTTAVALTGIPVCTGTLSASDCAGTFPVTEVSLVTPFELQVAHALNPNVLPFANLQYVGVAYDTPDDLVLFGISTWGPWGSPTDVAFNVYIDSQNNGTFDKILFNSNPGTMASSLFGRVADGQDSFLNGLFNVAKSTISIPSFTNLLPASAVDSRLFNNNVVILAASPKDLGLKGTSFRYRVESCPGFVPLCTPQIGFRYDAADGPFTYDIANPGLDFGGNFLALDLNGNALPVNFDVGNFRNNGSLGALLLHHHNSGGTEAQALPLQGQHFADLAVTSSVSPAVVKPAVNVPVTLTVTVTNGGPNIARGVTIFDGLPNGLTFVSDDGKGAYNPATGLWQVGQLAKGASATLHIKAKVTSGGQIVNTAQVASSRPIDPNPDNDISSLTINAPRLADLALTGKASKSSVPPGTPVTFTLTLKNKGPDPSYNPRVKVVLGGAQYGSVTASQGTFTSGIWQLGSVGSGLTETLQITVTPHASGSVGISAVATASTPDPITSNNSTVVTVQVQ